jgi:acyl-coenzyme A synthetase/AMP-(fatty) acid ligase
MAEWLALPHVASAGGRAARPVAWVDGERIERLAFVADVRAWQAAFSRHPGERWALYFDDCYAFACALFGAWHAGKAVLLPGDAQPATVQRLLQSVDGCAGELPEAITALPAAALQEAERPPLQPLDLHTTRLTLFTSGSSGEPLAIPKRLAQLDAEVHTLQATFGTQVDAGGAATVLATVSHQHIYGLLFCVLWPLAAGRPFVSRRLDYPEQLAQQLGAQPSLLVSSPAHLRRLPASLDWQAAQGALRAVFSSGGPLPAEAAQEALQHLGQSPIEVYGSSETGGIARRQRALQGERWLPFGGVDWRIDQGCLSVRSPNLETDDWWPTADLVQALPGGGFMLLGRADRIVKIEEKRVSLSAIERALAACDEVAEARALVVAGRLCVVLVPSESGWALLEADGKRAFDARLRETLLQSVERVALPRRWRHVRRLPANTQGKSTEALLAALFRPAMPAETWLERGPEHARAVLDVAPELVVFDGHFSAAQLLPGIAQVDWAISLARQAFAVQPARFKRLDTLKFQRPVLPGTQLELTLQWQPASGTLQFRYASAEGPHASGRIVFGISPDV